jgi:Amt family ammonium transporter
VHLVNGVWGTLALGVFYDDGVATSVAGLATGLSRFSQTLVQLKGVIYAGAFTFLGSLVVWYAIKMVLGVRVSPEEEEEGLDIGEHGMHAYDIPAFGTSANSAFGGAAPAGASLSPGREHV